MLIMVIGDRDGDMRRYALAQGHIVISAEAATFGTSTSTDCMRLARFVDVVAIGHGPRDIVEMEVAKDARHVVGNLKDLKAHLRKRDY